MKINYLIFMVVALLVMGCQSANASEKFAISPIDDSESTLEIPTQLLIKTPTETPTLVPPTITETPTSKALSDPLSLWRSSPHANTYDLSKGPNTYCAKCHSPYNWDPKAQIGTAPNCLSCKMPADPDPHVSKLNPLVPKVDWKSIDCQVCHNTNTNGDGTSPVLAWWNQGTGKYEIVSDGSELCSKCHVDTQKMKHTVDLSNSVHAGFTCLDCHNPHSTAASCSNSGCHEDIRKPVAQPINTPVVGHGQVGAADCGGPSCHISATEAAKTNSTIHGPVHSSIACIACHDASSAQVGRSEKTGAWGIFQTVEEDGVTLTYPSSSHEVTRQVDCKRCHYDGNPWNLSLVTGHEFEK